MSDVTTIVKNREASRTAVPKATTSVAALSPYQYGHGIDICHRFSPPESDDFLSKCLSAIALWIVGSGQLFERLEDSPFQTFLKNDSVAIKSDWSATSADLWEGIFRSANDTKAVADELQKYLRTLSESAKELESLSKKVEESSKRLEKQLELFKGG